MMASWRDAIKLSKDENAQYLDSSIQAILDISVNGVHQKILEGFNRLVICAAVV